MTATEEIHERAHDDDQIQATASGLMLKLVRAGEAIEHVPKDSRNTFHKYDYTSIEGLIRALRDELFSRNVLVTPGVDHIETRERQTRDGTSIVTTVYVLYTVFDADTGEQLFFQWAGQGDDPADKGLSKALTDARKTFFLQLLNIARGDDTEADSTTDERSSFSPTGSVNLTGEAKGLNNAQLNAILVAAELPAHQQPWGTFSRIPAEKAERVRELIRAERQ